MFFTRCLFHLHSFFDIILLVLIIFHSEPNVHSLSLSLDQWVGSGCGLLLLGSRGLINGRLCGCGFASNCFNVFIYFIVNDPVRS